MCFVGGQSQALGAVQDEDLSVGGLSGLGIQPQHKTTIIDIIDLSVISKWSKNMKRTIVPGFYWIYLLIHACS